MPDNPAAALAQRLLSVPWIHAQECYDSSTELGHRPGICTWLLLRGATRPCKPNPRPRPRGAAVIGLILAAAALVLVGGLAFVWWFLIPWREVKCR